MTKKLSKKRFGISLIEMIIAIFVLTTLATGAGTLVSTALRTVTSGKNRLTALSLATEGIEAVRAIYQTNLLRYPLHRDLCWNVMTWENECNADSPEENEFLQSGTYRVVANNDGRWILETTTDPDARLFISDDGEYIHGNSPLAQSPFSRTITISYPENNDPETDSYLRAASTVSWTTQGVPREVTLTEDFTEIPPSA